MSIACPADENECRKLLTTAFEQDHPVAVRYPRGAGAGVVTEAGLASLPFGRGEIRRQGSGIAVLAFGTLLHPALVAAEKLGATVVNMRWAKPLDVALLLEVAASHDALVTVEEACITGGAGSAVGEALQQAGVLKPLLQLGLQDDFTEHGDPAVLLAMQGLDAAGIEASINTRFAVLIQSRAAKVALKSVA
jgi:1-deoxy-D-xylulose-5-phosphate synthase